MAHLLTIASGTLSVLHGGSGSLGGHLTGFMRPGRTPLEPGTNPDDVNGNLPQYTTPQKFLITCLSPIISHLALHARRPAISTHLLQLQQQPYLTFMSTETHSAKAKVACDGPRETPITPEQSNAHNSSGAKDTETLFREAFERSRNETLEEHYERFPSLSE